ncbi:MAG: pilus assembly protein N-terminal domain-containing protein [Pseudorhodoplanes sp.]
MPVLLVGLARAALAAPENLTVVVDQAMMIRLPEKVATIVIGNPLIADIAVQPGGIAVVTGKGYGATNLIALDRAGVTLLEKNIVVQGPRDKVVVVYKGVERETYSCTPKCERRITLGDSPTYFEATLTQAGNRTGLEQGTPGVAK